MSEVTSIPRVAKVFVGIVAVALLGLFFARIYSSNGFMDISVVVPVPSDKLAHLKGTSFEVRDGYTGKISAVTATELGGKEGARVHTTVYGKLYLKPFHEDGLLNYAFPMGVEVMQAALRGHCKDVLKE